MTDAYEEAKKLTEIRQKIQSKDDLVSFILILIKFLKEYPEDWENITLESYLDALAAWINDMDGYFHNIGEPVPQQPDWELIGRSLMNASNYE